MKKIFLLLMALGLGFTGFSQVELKRNKKPVQDVTNKRVYHVTKNTSPATSPAMIYTQLSFKPFAELDGELQRKRGLGIITDEEYTTKKNALAPGGTLKIETRRRSIEQSDSKNFTVVIQDISGNEIQRISCPPAQGRMVPETLYLPQHYSTLVDLRIEAPLQGSDFNVYIMDDALGVKFEYIIKND